MLEQMQPETPFDDEDKQIIINFERRALPLSEEQPAQDSRSFWANPIPHEDLLTVFTEDELKTAARCLERGVIHNVELMEIKWIETGQFLMLLSRFNLFRLLPGEPKNLSAWIRIRDEDFKGTHETIIDSPLMKSYNLLNQRRNVYREWVYKIGSVAPGVMTYLRQAHNIDTLQAYSTVVDTDNPQVALIWAEDATIETSKDRSFKKAKIAKLISTHTGISLSSITPQMAERVLRAIKEQFPAAIEGTKIGKEWRGKIPRTDWIDREVVEVSEYETRITLRSVGTENELEELIKHLFPKKKM